MIWIIRFLKRAFFSASWLGGRQAEAHSPRTTGRLGLFFLAVWSVSLGSAQTPTVLPQVAFGGGWYSALFFTNQASTSASFNVSFFTDSGAPMVVPGLAASTVTVRLPGHGTATIEAPDTGLLTQGFATFALPFGVTGYGTFRQSVPGRPVQEAVVPFSSATGTAHRFPFDDRDLTTAVALVNPGTAAGAIAVKAYDEAGVALGVGSVGLAANTKTASVLRSLRGLEGIAGKRGSVEFSTTGGALGVLGLRFAGSAFTSIPATPIQPEVPTVPKTIPGPTITLTLDGDWSVQTNPPLPTNIILVFPSGSQATGNVSGRMYGNTIDFAKGPTALGLFARFSVLANGVPNGGFADFAFGSIPDKDHTTGSVRGPVTIGTAQSAQQITFTGTYSVVAIVYP
jgi:hypothetical protein